MRVEAVVGTEFNDMIRCIIVTSSSNVSEATSAPIIRDILENLTVYTTCNKPLRIVRHSSTKGQM
jgi:hypothetical protein